MCGATLFGSHQRHVFPPVWQRLVGFGFCVQRVGSTMQNSRRVGENSDLILSRLWTKVREIFRRCRKPLVHSNALSDCLCQVLFRRYSPLSLEVVDKRSKCKSFFGPQFLWEGRLRLLYGTLLGLPISWQSLVEFRLLIVFEAWQ